MLQNLPHCSARKVQAWFGCLTDRGPLYDGGGVLLGDGLCGTTSEPGPATLGTVVVVLPCAEDTPRARTRSSQRLYTDHPQSVS